MKKPLPTSTQSQTAKGRSQTLSAQKPKQPKKQAIIERQSIDLSDISDDQLNKAILTVQHEVMSQALLSLQRKSARVKANRNRQLMSSMNQAAKQPEQKQQT